MKKFLRPFFTPMGRKNTEAVTGTLLLLFCVEHLAANLFLLWPDPAPYQWYTESLGRSLLIRIMEVGLFALFIVHIGLGMKMRLHQRRVRMMNPRIPKVTNFASRTVGYTGIVILIFLVIHLARFFVPNRITRPTTFDLYEQAHIAFANIWYMLFYVVSMAALGFHLRHGIKSAIFSFKRLPPSSIPQLRRVGGWLAIIIPAGLAYIAVHIFITQ
ncbi:MAG: hypothetical protein KA339_09815 [Candidatus Kapabacteria bacterium]|nr:hypothetical protein [Candidatus Kapabacteria bacterium]MBP7093409.1 hypothetical protein [Candidatus Kapabacteria bacterium]